MDWRWVWFWSIIWSLCVHLVTFNWGAVQQDGADLRAWWQSLWAEISNRISGLRSYLLGYAFGIYVQVMNWINSQIAWVRGQLSWLQGYAFGLYVQAMNWVNDRIAWLRGIAYDLYNQARAFAQAAVDAFRYWVIPWVQGWVNNIRSWYDWIQGYRSLITGWLTQAKAVIDWLWHTAWGRLQAFLRDPIGYVLGWLLDPIRNLLGFWWDYGQRLRAFIVNDLSNLRNLLAAGFPLLRRFVDRPAETILELLAPVFIEWLAGLVADNW